MGFSTYTDRDIASEARDARKAFAKKLKSLGHTREDAKIHRGWKLRIGQNGVALVLESAHDLFSVML
jgi:hypothetical protein